MARLKSWIIIGMALASTGCIEAGKLKGKTMNRQPKDIENALEKLVQGHKDSFTEPSEEEISEIDFKVLDLEWEGEYITSPEIVEESKPGIPLLVLTRSSSLREWEVRLKRNGFVIAMDLERGEVWMRSLEKPPTKRLKPTQDVKGRKPDPEEGQIAGVFWQLIGEGRAEPLLPGEYAVAMINFDRTSNLRHVIKLGTAKPIIPAMAFERWPWNEWIEAKLFQKNVDSPEIEKGLTFALKIFGEKTNRKLMASISTIARQVNLIPPDPKRNSDPNIQAGIRVHLILMTLDKAPQMVSIAVPIFCTSPLHLGDSIEGWFNQGFPFEPSTEDQMLYAVVDGTLTGPYKVTGTNHN